MAAPSPSGIRWGAREPSLRRPSYANWNGAKRATEWSRCASAGEWARRGFSSGLRPGRKEGERRRVLTQRAQRKAEKTFLPVTPTALATELTSRPRILILLPAVIPPLRHSRNAYPGLLAIRRCSPLGRAWPLATA